MIKVSFQMSGIFDPQIQQIDIIQMIAMCDQTFTQEQDNLIGEKLPALTALIRDKGEIFEADLVLRGFDIPKSKDHLTLNRRRMILLTHECVIAKEQKRNDDKQAKVERKKMQKIQAAPLPKVWNSEEEDEVEVDEDPTAKGLEMVYIPVPTRSRPNSCKKKI